MYRSIIVVILITIGAYYAVQAPFYALLFYLWNAYFRPEDWVWHEFVRSLRLSTVIGGFLLLAMVPYRRQLVLDGRSALLWSFVGLGFLSAVSSNHSAVSLRYFLEFFKVITITYMLVVFVTDFHKFRLVIVTMVLSLGLLQAKQGWFYLLTSPGWANDNPVPFLGDNNGTAVGMLMLVPLVGLLNQTTKRKWGKQFYAMLLIGCLYRALSTYSRGGFLAAVTMAIAWWCRSSQKFKKLMFAAIILAIILPVLSAAFWNRMASIQTYEQEEDRSALGRLHYWSVALDMAAQNPFLGVGLNSYNDAYGFYDTSHGAYGQWRSVHSSHLGILSELGYSGLILYLIIIWMSLRACSQVRRLGFRDERMSEFAKSAVALQASIVAFMVGGSFVAIQYSEMFWHLVGLSIVLRRIALQQVKQLTLSRDPAVVSVAKLKDAAPLELAVR